MWTAVLTGEHRAHARQKGGGRQGLLRYDFSQISLCNRDLDVAAEKIEKAMCMATPEPIPIPTEPIGSIPRPRDLVARVAQGDSEDPELAPFYEDAIRDTIERFEATGSPVITDGEQRKYDNFATYTVHGLPNT